MSAIEGFGAGEDCFAALCFSCFALNSFLNRTAFPYDKPSLVKIGASASLEARSAIESLSFISCSEM
jgi:hypothetical protein